MAGGGSSRGSGGKKKARIEIIPLIDVIFFLLATFVLFTLSLNKPVGLPVTLPDAETGIPRDPNGIPTVTVQEDGTPAWEQEPVTLQELITRLQDFARQHVGDPETHIIINGDANAPWSQVVYVFDQAHRAGIPKIFIETHAKGGHA